VTDPSSPEGVEPHEARAARIAAAETALQDPIGEETRKSRLYLLGLGMVGIAIVHTGLVPQELTTLGLKFGEANRQALLIILALVVLYYLTAFLLYGTSEFVAWRLAYHRAFVEYRRKSGLQSDDEEAIVFRSYLLARGVSIFRSFFEFILPVLVGSYAVGALIFGAASW
jgi:hypothetical protein